jgi:hypothetical protein
MTRRCVERCVGDTGYLLGWIVMRTTGEAECWHTTHAEALACAFLQAGGSAHGR